MAVVAWARENLWLRYLIEDIWDIPIIHPTPLYYTEKGFTITVGEDNTACISMSKGKQSSKTKYFSRDWHKVVDRIKNKEFELVKIPTEENRADLFTKPLKTPRFRFLKTKLMGGETIQNHFQTPPNHINWKGEEGSQPTQSYTHTAHSNIPQRANMRFTHANI